MNKENKWLRRGLITTYIIICSFTIFVMSYYPYPDSLLLKIFYGIIGVALLFGIWAVYVLTKD